MLERLLKLVTYVTAAFTIIDSATAKVVVNRPNEGSTTLVMGCASVYFTGQYFEVPDELVPDKNGDKPNCLFGDGTIRNICTGEILKKIDLAENHLELKNEDVTKVEATYSIQPPPLFKEKCNREVVFKQPITAKLKQNQRVMFLGNGQLVEQMSGKLIKKLKEGVDYELMETIEEKSVSDEDMADLYRHNRAQESKFRV